MRRHLLILGALAAVMFFVVWQSQEIILAYYLLSALWLLPLYYFFKEKVLQDGKATGSLETVDQQLGLLLSMDAMVGNMEDN